MREKDARGTRSQVRRYRLTSGTIRVAGAGWVFRFNRRAKNPMTMPMTTDN